MPEGRIHMFFLLSNSLCFLPQTLICDFWYIDSTLCFNIPIEEYAAPIIYKPIKKVYSFIRDLGRCDRLLMTACVNNTAQVRAWYRCDQHNYKIIHLKCCNLIGEPEHKLHVDLDTLDPALYSIRVKVKGGDV